MRNIKITFLLLCLGYANATNFGGGRLGGTGRRGNSEYRSSSPECTEGDEALAWATHIQLNGTENQLPIGIGSQNLPGNSNQSCVRVQIFSDMKAAVAYILNNPDQFTPKYVENVKYHGLNTFGSLLFPLGVPRHSHAFWAAFGLMVSFPNNGQERNTVFFGDVGSLKKHEATKGVLAGFVDTFKGMDINGPREFGVILATVFEMAGMAQPKWLTDFLTNEPQGPQSLSDSGHDETRPATHNDRQPGAGIVFEDGTMFEDPEKVQFSQKITQLLDDAANALQRGGITALKSMFDDTRIMDILAQFEKHLEQSELRQIYIDMINQFGQLFEQLIENISMDKLNELYDLIETFSNIVTADHNIDTFRKQQINRIFEFIQQNKTQLSRIAAAMESGAGVSSLNPAYANGDGGGRTPMNMGMDRQDLWEEPNEFGMRPLPVRGNGHSSPSQRSTAANGSGYASSQAAGVPVAAASAMREDKMKTEELQSVARFITNESQNICNMLSRLAHAAKQENNSSVDGKILVDIANQYTALQDFLNKELKTLKESLKRENIQFNMWLSDDRPDEQFSYTLPQRFNRFDELVGFFNMIKTFTDYYRNSIPNHFLWIQDRTWDIIKKHSTRLLKEGIQDLINQGNTIKNQATDSNHSIPGN